MKDFVKSYLEKLGYSLNRDAYEVIDAAKAWYENRVIEEFHRRTNLNNVCYELNRMNFAKRCCADDANLCEIISVVPEKNSDSLKFIEDLLRKNRFDVMYRQQLEKTSATGTVGAYITLQNATQYLHEDDHISIRGGDIRINYVDSDGICPLSVENGLVTECAFSGTSKFNGKTKTTLVIFRVKSGFYNAETVVFNELGVKIENECMTVQLGDVRPFAIMQNAEVNNLPEMYGFGLPKVYNAIPTLKVMDLCFNVLYSDLSKADKIVLINEALSEIRTKDGKATLTPQQKEIFVLLGEHLPSEKSLIQEYNPEIRIEEITKAFELGLSLLSLMFGYGTKKYTFENGKITTATEYIGEKQDSMQELNKQRKQATDYITDIIHAAMWFSNAFHGTTYNVEEELNIEFDDSYIEDKQAKRESLRNDALSFDIPFLKVMYLMEAYNFTQEEAEKLVNTEPESEEEPPED